MVGETSVGSPAVEEWSRAMRRQERSAAREVPVRRERSSAREPDFVEGIFSVFFVSPRHGDERLGHTKFLSILSGVSPR